MKRKPHHLSTKVTLYFVLILLVAVVTLTLLAGSLFQNRVAEESDQVARQQISLGALELSHTLSQLRALYFTVVHDEVLQTGIRQLREQGGEISLVDFLPVSERLSAIADNYAFVRSIFLIDYAGHILSPIYSAEPYCSWLLNDPDYLRYLDSGLSIRFSAPSSFPILQKNASDDKRNTIILHGAYYSLDKYEVVGTVAIAVTKASLMGNWPAIAASAFTAACIVDAQGAVVCRSESLADVSGAEMLLMNEGGQTLGDTSYLAYRRAVPEYPEWTVIGLISRESLLTPMRLFYQQMIVVLLGVAVVFVLMAATLSHRFTAPLKALSRGMSKVGKGKWQPVPADSATIETQEITASYNAMVLSLETLTQKIKEEQAQKERIKLEKLQSELELLQSQINPHFIHNTLNTMRYMAQRDKNDDLAKIIVSFNSLLRASMSQTDSVHPLREEVALLESYLNIQLKRFDVQVAFLIDLSEASLEVLLPKLLLQPLVENALYHGILPNGRGTIELHGRVADHRLWITLIDDGAGIPAGKLEKLLSGELPNTRGYNQIGLININSRLRLFYGAASHLLIDSREGKGTAINFSIPALAKRELSDDLDESV